MKKRIVSVLCCVVLAGSMLMGCGGSKDAVKAKSSDADLTKSDKDDLTIEMVCSTSSIPGGEDNFIAKAVKEKLGINIKMSNVGAGTDYATAVNARVTGGDVPDMFVIPSRESMYQYADNGVILDLAPYKDKLKSVIEYTGGDEKLRADKYKDGWYLIPQKQGFQTNCVLVKKNWMEKLGQTVPTTMEGVLDLAKQFTFNDPDGNGKNDTFGLSGATVAGFSTILNAYDASAMNEVQIIDGKVTSTLLSPHMKEGLQMCKKFVDAGVVDPDIIANSGTTLRDKLIQNKVGVVMGMWEDLLKKLYTDQMKEVDPNAEWVPINPPVGEEGIEPKSGEYDISDRAGQWVVSGALKDNKKKLDQVIKLLNYMVSDEGAKLFEYGIEGRHYNMDGDKVVPTDLMSKECDWMWAFQVCFRDNSTYLKTKFPECIPYIDFSNKIKRVEHYNNAIDVPEGIHKEDMDKYIQDNMIKFIYGKRPIKEYDQFIKELNTSYQFKDYMKSAEKQLKEKGYLK